MTDEERKILEPFLRFVKAREKAWKDKPDDGAFYGEKYPGNNLTHGDFRRLAKLAEE